MLSNTPLREMQYHGGDLLYTESISIDQASARASITTLTRTSDASSRLGFHQDTRIENAFPVPGKVEHRS
jgi:hypothetical protein